MIKLWIPYDYAGIRPELILIDYCQNLWTHFYMLYLSFSSLDLGVHFGTVISITILIYEQLKMNLPTFSHWSYLGAAVLPEYIWGRGHGPVLHTETLEGVVPQHLHHTGLWPGHHDHPSRQTNVYKGQSRSIVRNLPYAYTDHGFFLYVRHCSSMAWQPEFSCI